jgi:hypothetical protein
MNAFRIFRNLIRGDKGKEMREVLRLINRDAYGRKALLPKIRHAKHIVSTGMTPDEYQKWHDSLEPWMKK